MIFFFQDKKFYLVSEYCEYSNLKNILETHDKGSENPFGIDIINNILLQISLALMEFHDKDIIHRNLKTKNIFISKDKKIIKVGCFGFDKLLPNKEINLDNNISLEQQENFAPEIIENFYYNYNNKIDIYSFGCIAFELYTLKKYEKKYGYKAFFEINKKVDEAFLEIEKKDIKIANLIRACLSEKPEERPTSQQIFDYIRQPYPEEIFSISPFNATNYVIDVDQGSLNDRTPVIIWDDNSEKKQNQNQNQRFQFLFNYEEDNYKIMAIHSKKFLTVGQERSEVNNIYQMKGQNENNQKWKIIRNENGFQIKSEIIQTFYAPEFIKEKNRKILSCCLNSKRGDMVFCTLENNDPKTNNLIQSFLINNASKLMPIQNTSYYIKQKSNKKALTLEQIDKKDYQVILEDKGFKNNKRKIFQIFDIFNWDKIGLYYTIKQYETNNYLTHNKENNNVEIKQMEAPQENQLWMFISEGQGSYKILTYDKTKALKLEEGKPLVDTKFVCSYDKDSVSYVLERK